MRLLSDYDVPATWAVVGHRFLRDCDGVHVGHPPPDGWFHRERGRGLTDRIFGSAGISSLICFPQMSIRKLPVNHFLTFCPMTHVTEAITRAEIEAAIAAFPKLAVPYLSFGSRLNRVGYTELLAEYGFTWYRSLPMEPPVSTVDPTPQSGAFLGPPVCVG